MVYHRQGRPTYYLKLPTRTGWIQRSTGTSDRATAKAIERMLVDLGPKGKRAWDLLDDVAADRLTLGELFDAWSNDDLAGLRARRVDVDLSGEVAGWQGWLRDRVAPETGSHYLAHLRTLMSHQSLEEVFAELVLETNPEQTAHDIADVVAGHA